ncbi:phosphate-repressible phosphate permease [Coccidioides immitis RS]|uniref:Phosphate transporter n=1 Tax=Coccidioides immitis (strain RS) TaxID=246410 RepID=J3KA64_COCIM|nr:phosphate-repressible phosphate permease [Coccidioides immitis RS]EAS31878.3 phosphate-repressible phosphate permease [Coccidioides immitis RS]
MAVLEKYDWIIAIISIAFCASSFGNGANDVANSYATSVAARTLTMPQVGVLSMITEFVGAVALGSRVTKTIKNGIIDINRFNPAPATLILGMGCAEVGSAFWLITATSLGFPVSTTQTVVGALIGVGFASQASIKWEWTSGSVSQVAASWGIAPAIAAGFSALIFATIKYSVHNRSDSLKWALRMIPFYLAFTAAILALFIIVEIPNGQSFEEFGVGKMCGIIFGVFFGCLAIAYTFFLPYFHRRLVKEDARLRARHIPLGPLLWKDDPWIYWPAPADGDCVIDYYESSHNRTADSPDDLKKENGGDSSDAANIEKGPVGPAQSPLAAKQHLEPDERFLAPYRHLAIFHPLRLWSFVKYFLLQGVTRDCVTHDSDRLAATHARAARYDNRVEHLWTYAQVASAMVMSIAHGSNDVANAVGPWVAAYETYRAGIVQTKTDTPIWILVIAGFLLGAGFWFFGFHIIRALGNRITQMSPTRGFSMELGAAITVLLASRLGLPVSTTQCLTGATVGTALMNYDLGAVNWRQLLWIFGGWVLTLPCAGLVSGLLMLMALNTPHF